MSLLFQPQIPPPFSTDQAFQKFVEKECDHLGEGTSRAVHSVRGAEFVVKVALDERKVACNWTEVVAFHAFPNDRAKLAKVVSWSISGRFIVMEKLDMDERPSELFQHPHWMNDRKPSSLGRSGDGRFKVCDFAFVIPPDSSPSSEFV